MKMITELLLLKEAAEKQKNQFDETRLQHLFSLPPQEASKIIKQKNIQILPGKWHAVKTGEYETDTGYSLTFHSTTTYKKSNRLRLPDKTKYHVYAYLRNNKNHWTISAQFGSATGESYESNQKIDKAREKAIKWAKDTFDIEIGKFSFKF